MSIDDRAIFGIIFLDTAQRFHRAMKGTDIGQRPIEEQKALIETLFKQASNDSILVRGGDIENELLGKAWVKFLHQRNEAVLTKFINRLSAAEIRQELDHLPNIEQRYKEYATNPVGMVGSLFSPRFFAAGGKMRDIAQDTGMLDYKAGETLSGTINKLRAEIREKEGYPPPPPPEQEKLEPMAVAPINPVALGPKPGTTRA